MTSTHNQSKIKGATILLWLCVWHLFAKGYLLLVIDNLKWLPPSVYCRGCALDRGIWGFDSREGHWNVKLINLLSSLKKKGPGCSEPQPPLALRVYSLSVKWLFPFESAGPPHYPSPSGVCRRTKLTLGSPSSSCPSEPPSTWTGRPSSSPWHQSSLPKWIISNSTPDRCGHQRDFFCHKQNRIAVKS